MVCQDALEETVASAEFKNWIRSGDDGQSCPVVPADTRVSCKLKAVMSLAELQIQGDDCRHAVKRDDMFARAKQLVATVE